MKWDNDPNKELKLDIFDILRTGLKIGDAERITINHLVNCIEEMMSKLLGGQNDKPY